MTTRDMNERVTLHKPGGTVDEAGQPVSGMIQVAVVWADVRYLPGLSAIKAGADMTLNRASVRIYKREADAGFQVHHRGNILEVDSVNPVHGTRFIDLVCHTVN